MKNKMIAVVCIWIFFFGGASGLTGQSRGEKPVAFGPAKPLSEILNSDGTVKLGPGASGSFDPRGFRMIAGPGQAPQFVTESASPAPSKGGEIAGASGEGYWDERFTPVGASGPINALVVNNGILYAGGDFHYIGDVSAKHIAKWDGTSWSALGSGTNSGVRALAVSGTDLYAGGLFDTAGGVTANHIAKWNGTNWAALGTGMNSDVRALAVSGTDLYAGGWFTTAGGVAANCIAKWNGTSWSALGSGLNNAVMALAVSGSDLYAGGWFVIAGGVAANCIAKWNGTSWSALGSGVKGEVHALAVSGTDLYAGGYFDTAGEVTANHIAKWNGTNWSALGSGISTTDGNVIALAVSGTDLYAGGSFDMAGGNISNNIAKWNGSLWSALGGAHGAGMNNGLFSLAVSGTDLYAGGDFTTAGGVIVNHIAKWNGTSWSALGSGTNYNWVNALAVSGTDLYAGGPFWKAGGVAVDSIAKWNGTSWSALGSGLIGVDYPHVTTALAVSGTDLYAGGSFTTAGGVAANCIAKWNGTSWSALGSGMNGIVYALAVSGTNLYAGGSFTTAGGVTANYIAKWSGTSWSALGTGMNSDVRALAVLGTDLYAGGSFTTAGGVAANYIAKWNGTSWSALDSGVSNIVYALAVAGTDLYAGGSFTTAGGVAANCIAKWNGTSWSALGSGLDDAVSSLAVLGADLYVGGRFGAAGGKPSANFAIWHAGAVPPWPTINLSKSSLNFGAVLGGTATAGQAVVISNTGVGTLAWTAAPAGEWITVSQASGTGGGTVSVGVNPAGLGAGNYTGSVSFSDPNATNSPQAVTVNLKVFAAGGSLPPFGEFSTPIDYTTGVTGAIPVTGWVVDDIETLLVEVKRAPVAGDPPGAIGPDNLVFIGDAIFVEGARPDVEAAYPGYPLNYRAGWGYMLLTNFLPGQGNGDFTLYAIATDGEGNMLTLGTKTIRCSNATAVKPFGTIDTPAQGGTISANPYVNFGWVLTPLPKTVPKNGSTIDVYVDSVLVGNLSTAPNVYNQYRPDVSGNFPGLNNTGGPGEGGPVGARFVDTSTLANGVHTIWWVAYDDVGQGDGIGSRYFNFVNTGTAPEKQGRESISMTSALPKIADLKNSPMGFDPILVETGFDREAKPATLLPDRNCVYRIEIPEVNRLEIDLRSELDLIGAHPGRSRYTGYLVFGNELRPLPIGSTLDCRTGRFSWMPGPGFLGSYDIIFVESDAGGLLRSRRVRVEITPKR